ncbi:MAG: 23S rRNA (adenine(2503)-C(2))-methyltransferase RlmN [Clostridiales bacterium]|nr:23S rRNA (adenine(2503)-C(2))-methyltransferase RlmN [Clostridiales bacterium]
MDNVSKKYCLDLTEEELLQWCLDNGYPRFRAGQIMKWLTSGVTDTSKMTNIPASMRQQLESDFSFSRMKIIDEFISEIDGTRKLVYLLPDGNIIETVIMRYKTGLSVCISSQAGCKMGCTFCASAKAGFGRSLTAGEMAAQVLMSSEHIGEKIRTVVVMGIGEPFDNFENLITFIKLMNDPDGVNMGARHITVSTCGIVPKIKEFTAMKLQVNLAISLHAPNDELRRELMPVASAYSITELIKACREYVDVTGRRITFEYSLFNEVNDTFACAEQLSTLLKGLNCHVNLIAANEFPSSPYKRSAPGRVQAFKKALESRGVNATLRREMGTDIMAACGQLRRGIEEDMRKEV